MTKAAVLTGDVVRSGKLSAAELDRLFAELAAGVAAVATWPGAGASIGLERNRGDGWQALIAAPKWALRACLVLRARLIAKDAGFDTRIAVGIGSVAHVSPAGLHASDGEAFRRSGRALEAMKGPRNFAVDVEGAETKAASLTAAVFGLCDQIAGDWTPAQAEALALALTPAAPTQDDIAARIGASQQAVQQRLSRGGGPALAGALSAFEAAVSANVHIA